MIRLVDGTLGPLLVFLADWSIRWGVLILGLAAWFRVHPPRRAATRHLLGVTTLLAGLLLPLAPTWTAPWPWVRLLPIASGPPPLTARAIEPPPRIARAVEPVPAMGPNPVEPPPTAPAVVQVNRSKPDHKAGERIGMGRMAWLGLGTAWLVGTTWFLVRLVVGQVVLARLRRSARPITGPSRAVFEAARRAASLDGRRVEVATHPSVGSPVVLGGRRATVLVPEDWDQWGATAQRACLLHELAHLARRDDGWKLLAELARAPFWVHPGVAWLQARLDREAELACDEATVALGVPPVELARLLLDCARQPHRLHPRAFPINRPALSFFGRETVSARITRLLEDTMPLALIRPSRSQMFGLIASVAALALAIGGAQVAAIEPTPPAPLLTPPSPPLAAQNPVVAPAPVSLTVQDNAGRPVAGATVLLRKREGERTNNYRTLAEAQTDASGSVRFERLTESGDWFLVFKDGYCYVIQNLVDPAGKPLTSVTLPPPRSLAGLITDDAGQPVAGAEVRITMTGTRTGNQTSYGNINTHIKGTPLEGVPITRTDHQGRFRFTMLPDDPEVGLRTLAQGKGTIATWTQSVLGVPDDLVENRLRIKLAPEVRVVGRIVSKVPGLTVAGRMVGVQALDNQGIASESVSELDTTTSDAEGRFEFGQVTGVEAGVFLRPVPADSPWVFRPALHIPIQPGQTSVATVELIEGVVVSGSLTGTDGQPIAGVEVSARFGGRFLGRFVALGSKTDAAGTYRFRLPPGPAEISLNSFIVPYTLVNAAEARRDFNVPEGVTTYTMPPILVAPTIQLIGRVVDAANRPIDGARVFVRGAREVMFAGDQQSFVTDVDGRFTAGKLSDGQVIPADPGFTLQIRLADGRSFDASLVTKRGDAEATVKLPILLANGLKGPEQVAPDEIAGVVVDPRGKPLAGVLAHAYSWVPDFKVFSDQEGRFRIKTLPEQGKLEVRLSKEGYEPREFLAQPTGEAGWVVVMGNSTYFEGRVVAPDGSPIPDAPIRADSGPKRMAGSRMRECWTEGRSDKEGRYRLYVEPGVYEFQVRVPNAGVLRLAKQAIATDEVRPLDLMLAPGVDFVARIVDAETEAPVAGFTINDWQNPVITGTSDAGGTLRIADMMPGPFLFRMIRKNEGYARWWSDACLTEFTRFQKAFRFGFQRNFDGLDFDMQPGMAPVTIRVERAATIRGVVLDPDGKPVAGATVAPALTGSGNSLTGDTRFSVETDKDGAYTMNLPASGDIAYNLVAHDGKYQETRTWGNGIIPPFQTKPGQVLADVTLRLTRAATVRGKVVDAVSGQPIAGREVRASAADKRENRYYDPTTKTEPDGTFTLRGIRPGEQFIQTSPFWLDATQAAGGSSQTFTLNAGEVREGVVLKTTTQER